MTDPLAPVQAALTTADQAVTAQLAAAAAQHTADQATIAAQAAQIAALEAQLNPPPPAPTPASTAFGVNAPPAQYQNYETLLGGAAVLRYYFQAGEGVHWPTDVTLTAGQIFVISSKIKPQDLTAAQLAAFFGQCPTDRDTYYCIWHEPRSELAAGTFTKAQLDAGWVLARQAQQQAGNPRVKLIAILEGIAFLGANNPDTELPADLSTIDAIGVDPYFSGTIGQPIANLGGVLDTVKAAADARGLPWAVCETGVGQNLTGQARLDALTALAAGIRQRNAVFSCYFLGNTNTTQWSLSAGDGSAAAWKAGQTG